MRRGEDTVELRADCPRWIADVLDAVSQPTRSTRAQVFIRVLEEWAQQRVHEATVIARVLQINPNGSEKSGKEREQ